MSDMDEDEMDLKAALDRARSQSVEIEQEARRNQRIMWIALLACTLLAVGITYFVTTRADEARQQAATSQQQVDELVQRVKKACATPGLREQLLEQGSCQKAQQVSEEPAAEAPVGVAAPGRDGIDGTNGTNGTDGTDGQDGEDGPPGPAGPRGRDGQDGEDGETVVGPQGRDGSDGQDSQVPGPAGRDGESIAGPRGGDGAAGPSGPAGKDGESIVGPPGPAGKDGSNGTNGTNGTDGQDGEDGRGITRIACSPSGALVVTYTDGTEQTVDGATACEPAPVVDPTPTETVAVP